MGNCEKWVSLERKSDGMCQETDLLLMHILLMSFRGFTTYVHYFLTQSEEVPGTVHSGDFRHCGNNFTNQRNS